MRPPRATAAEAAAMHAARRQLYTDWKARPKLPPLPPGFVRLRCAPERSQCPEAIARGWRRYTAAWTWQRDVPAAAAAGEIASCAALRLHVRADPGLVHAT